MNCKHEKIGWTVTQLNIMGSPSMSVDFGCVECNEPFDAEDIKVVTKVRHQAREGVVRAGRAHDKFLYRSVEIVGGKISTSFEEGENLKHDMHRAIKALDALNKEE